MPFNIKILTGSNVSIYQQIVDQVCAAILSGQIADDEPLPSVRGLAEDLLINPNTVGRAYGELVREGILESRPGRGMFVSKRRQIYSKAERTRRIDQAVTSLVSQAFRLGFSSEEIVDEVAKKDEGTVERFKEWRRIAMTSHSNGNRNAVIETHNLTKYFGARKAVDALTMAVPRGSVFAFLGRNGSGKTTTIRMLLGLTEPTRGSSRILGHDSQSLPPEVRARIGYMSESHSLYDSLTVRQNGEYQSRFYPRWNERIFQAVAGHFRLDPRTKAGQLSRGERAGLALAITLAPEPELLVLDDPAIGLDPVARRSLLESDDLRHAGIQSDHLLLFAFARGR
jgi:ABC-type Na+ transport system ATPase subunit NatA/DNA-binding transcriptional regulator YhcF (GntR family)